MKDQWKGFISGVCAALLLVGLIGTAAATVGTRTAELSYNDIKVTLDGAEVNLVDANGNPVEPFIIDGTTYLPIRAISNAFGLNVGWDSATQTVILSHPGDAEPTPAPAPDPAPAQTPSTSTSTSNSTPAQTAPTVGRTVYITPTGSKYHYSSSCNGGTYIPSTLEEALRRGLTPCSRCVN